MKKIAIFASGSGSNAENIVKYFSPRIDIKIDIILSNNKDSYAIQRAKNLNIDFYCFTKNDFYNSEIILNLLLEREIDLIILAGFLLLVPEYLISNYKNRIINIHPALLPKYGGKGMYGNNVHKAVLENKEKISGITIHYINENYDQGDIIFQKECAVSEKDNINDLANRIHKLEFEFLPIIIDEILKK